MRTILAVMLLSGIAIAQEPLKILGTFTCTQRPETITNPEGKVVQVNRVTGSGPVGLKNVSGRRIVAVILKLDANCGNIGTQMTYKHDMIFKAHGFEAGDIINLPVDVDESRSGDVNFNSGTLNIVPLFAQFEDGSTWGDTSQGQIFTNCRSDALQWLANLRSISDDEQFNVALDAPTTKSIFPIQKSLQLVRDQFGPTTVRATILDRLNTYNTRMANGRF